MPKRFYLDSAIWRDYYENREDRFRPLGKWALYFINKIIKNKELILYSDFVIKELEIKYNLEEINNILEIAKEIDLLVKVNISKSQVIEAAVLSKKRRIAFGNALHAILAKDNKAIMITRDKHFLELINIVEIKKPEDLI